MWRGKLSKGLYVNPVDAFAVAQRLLLHHLTTVAYHRIYINAVVSARAIWYHIQYGSNIEAHIVEDCPRVG